MKNEAALMKLNFFTVFFLIFLVTACSTKSEEKIVLTVSSASSLKDSLEEIAEKFQKEHPNIQVQFNFGASGALQKQIEQGAPVDLFISSSLSDFEKLKQKNMIADEKQLLRNELVLIANKNLKRVNNLQDLNSGTIEKLAIGMPSVVPAGEYALQALEFYGVKKNIQSKLVYAKDVRQVLTYVETGNTQAGIVYKTDALTSKKIRIIHTFADESHHPIIYPAGIVKTSENKNEARIFLNFLSQKNLQKIWKKYGFETE